MFTNINRKSVESFIVYIIDPILLIIISIMVILTSNTFLVHPISCSALKTDYSVRQTFRDYVQQQCGIALYNYKFTKTEEDVEILPENPVEGKQLYMQYISEIVDKHYPDLDKEIISAIVYHESRFQPDSINEKTNATGLMQILPKWHTERARKLGVTDLSDPYGNILVGCDILNELYQQKKSMNYALDFYAGGYKYAESNRNSVSTYRKELNEILKSDVLGKE